MTHRAEQSLEALKDSIETRVQPQGVHTYLHRQLSLSRGQDELPAISVEYGGEELVGERNTAYIDSLLAVGIVITVAGPEDVVKSELMRLMAEVHIALSIDTQQSLPDVIIGTFWNGADPPEYDGDGEEFIGQLTANWLVHYRMNYDDPN